MNMTVSLLIPVEGYLGGSEDLLKAFIENVCQTQRLAEWNGVVSSKRRYC